MSDSERLEELDHKARLRRTSVILTGLAVFGTVSSAAEADGGRFMYSVLHLVGLR